MAKKLKKRKKLTKRSQATQPKAKAARSSAEPTKPSSAAKPLRPQEPTGITEQAPERTAPAHAPAATTVTFRDASKRRAPDGVDAEMAEVEYPAIRRDLRRLGISIAVFSLLIAGMAILNNATGAVTDLGEQLFRLWQ